MGLLDIFWSMLWFFMFIIWIWLLITIFADIFRNKDLNGWAKALWILFVIITPFLGVLIYVIVNGNSMQERAQMQRNDIPEASGGSSDADEVAKLADLHDKGVLTDEEFAAQKAKLLA